jgi:hypothetical protein
MPLQQNTSGGIINLVKSGFESKPSSYWVILIYDKIFFVIALT